jgi:(p)ppGpp synthase/HD superfamily hydrolase
MNLILQAAKWAHEAHKDQVRKYNGRLFIEHPMRVAGWTSLMRDQQPEYVAAAWLHDVKEDNWHYWLKIEALIPGSVRIIVDQLTNPSKKHPESEPSPAEGDGSKASHRVRRLHEGHQDDRPLRQPVRCGRGRG